MEDPDAIVVFGFLVPLALSLDRPLVKGSGATKEVGEAPGTRALGMASVRKGNCDAGEIE
jgi:hypothetical protein